ncbi:ATP-binding cassette domain-containing protein [Pseudomonas sp. CCM 7891]|uniref:ATP-binding cassette domain-containing protein n=1 Tax=Pseudomonas karstica TaxID=1055468 RepID=A0A7X2RR09_9PSED|nr:ABC transporter ATP-binding protein [Pseudomonas karstica]MTD19433.1 ATP-binding cassette domain-containing protein [Pseudomonas karstica]
MIEIKNLTKYYGRSCVISDFNFCTQHKESLGIFGHDGAGKTTLIKMLARAILPSSGHIKMFGSNADITHQQAKKIIGYQPESALSHSAMTVKGFLEFIADVRGFCGVNKRKVVDRAVDRLELRPTLKYPVEILPPGLKRRVSIAQAILHEPALLLLDEPTEGLAPHQKQAIRTLIKSLSSEMNVIIASRAPEEVACVCDRALIISGGRLLADSPVPDLMRSSRHYQAVTLAADAPLDLLALAVLPGVAGIEEHRQTPGTVTIVAMPGQIIYPHIIALIANRRWKINALNLEPGRLDDVVHHLSQEAST